jgi:hypothetical protein
MPERYLPSPPLVSHGLRLCLPLFPVKVSPARTLFPVYHTFDAALNGPRHFSRNGPSLMLLSTCLNKFIIATTSVVIPRLWFTRALLSKAPASYAFLLYYHTFDVVLTVLNTFHAMGPSIMPFSTCLNNICHQAPLSVVIPLCFRCFLC